MTDLLADLLTDFKTGYTFCNFDWITYCFFTDLFKDLMTGLPKFIISLLKNVELKKLK